MSIRLRIALVAVLSVVLAANAAATLYAAATAPTIKACVAKSGVMRYVPSGKCASGEKALVWNVQGPVGATGPAGPAGSGGTAAAPVTYAGKWTKTKPLFGVDRVWTVASLDLPAGTYDIRAVGWIDAVGTEHGDEWGWVTFYCDFANLSWSAGFYGPYSSQRSIALENVLTLASSKTVEMTCKENGDVDAYKHDGVEAFIIATPVTLK